MAPPRVVWSWPLARLRRLAPKDEELSEMFSTQEAEILRYLGAAALEGRTTDEADALGRASALALVARYKI